MTIASLVLSTNLRRLIVNRQLIYSSSSYVVNQRGFSVCVAKFQVRKESDKDEGVFKDIVESKGNTQISTHVSPAKKAKQAVADASYGVFILIGGAMLLGIFYYLFTELFSRETPSGIYDESSKMCLENFDVSFV